jgi:hypothetical protein
VLIYALFAIIFVAQAVCVLFMPEPGTRRPGALASLKPHFRLPADVRQALLVSAPAIIGAWALAGFYGC